MRLTQISRQRGVCLLLSPLQALLHLGSGVPPADRPDASGAEVGLQLATLKLLHQRQAGREPVNARAGARILDRWICAVELGELLEHLRLLLFLQPAPGGDLMTQPLVGHRCIQQLDWISHGA